MTTTLVQTAGTLVDHSAEPPTEPPAHSSAVSSPATSSRVLGLICRSCRLEQPLGLRYVCPHCFGPLQVRYDLKLIAGLVDRSVIESRPPGIWRYLELLPVERVPRRSLAVGSTPLIAAERLGASLGIDRLWLKDDTRNPSLSFKDRAVAIAAALAMDWELPALACASTGNLAAATAAAAAAVGLPAYVFIPADLERAKIEHALAYGATVVPLDGTYDDVNRVCIELADETGWGFVNINLRPLYTEGSRTVAFEIAEGLGWRSPDVVVVPIGSGALLGKLVQGFDELATVGLIARRPIRFVGAQAAGCAPVADAWSTGAAEMVPVRRPNTIVRSLAIGSPADGSHVLRLVRECGGSVEAIADANTAAAIRDVAALEGIYPETAGGVTLAAARAARERGIIRDGDEVVALLTGNGLKTPDARHVGLRAGPGEPGEGGLAPVLPATFDAVESWLEGRS
ncbi:MAG: threonine synthase [Chloroflexi bacterium]|nr:threonine synthase [Chloroflexota bacterium]